MNFILCDPGWYVHKPDVQTEWNDKKMSIIAPHRVPCDLELNLGLSSVLYSPVLPTCYNHFIPILIVGVGERSVY